jgi:hypothetical protein
VPTRTTDFCVVQIANHGQWLLADRLVGLIAVIKHAVVWSMNRLTRKNKSRPFAIPIKCQWYIIEPIRGYWVVSHLRLSKMLSLDSRMFVRASNFPWGEKLSASDCASDSPSLGGLIESRWSSSRVCSIQGAL